MRSPFTAMIFTLELTHDLNLLPALLMSCIAAHAVTVLVLRRSILTEKVARRGHHLIREYSTDPLEMQRVAEVMTPDAPTVPASTRVREVADRIEHGDEWLTHHHAVLIVNRNAELVGIITRGDVARALRKDSSGSLTVLEAGSDRPIVTYPDELVYNAIAEMLEHNVGRLPVVSRGNPRRLVGYLGRSSVLTALLRQIEEEKMREPGWLARLAPLGTRWAVGRRRTTVLPKPGSEANDKLVSSASSSSGRNGS